MKEWLALKERHQAGQLPLIDYLERINNLRVMGNGERGTKTAGVTRLPFPGVEALLSRDEKKVKQIDVLVLMREIKALEDELVETGLPSERDRKTYGYYQSVLLLEKLNTIQLSAEEYASLKSSLESLKTEDVARFIAQESRRSLVLFKSWEELISDSIKFYELAKKRDEAIEKILGDSVEGIGYRKNENNEYPSAKPYPLNPNVSVLVFGGFHKEAIKRILKEKGISYVILAPSFGAPSKRHEEYYRMLMSGGKHAFEMLDSISKGLKTNDQRLTTQNGKSRWSTVDSLQSGKNVAHESNRPANIFLNPDSSAIVSSLAKTASPLRSELRQDFILKMDRALERRPETRDQRLEPPAETNRSEIRDKGTPLRRTASGELQLLMRRSRIGEAVRFLGRIFSRRLFLTIATKIRHGEILPWLEIELPRWVDRDLIKNAVLLYVDKHPDASQFEGYSISGNVNRRIHEKKLVKEIWWAAASPDAERKALPNHDYSLFEKILHFSDEFPVTDLPVILSIDLDAFASVHEKLSSEEIQTRLELFLEQLKFRKYRILGVFIAESTGVDSEAPYEPAYTRKEYVPMLKARIKKALSRSYRLQGSPPHAEMPLKRSSGASLPALDVRPNRTPSSEVATAAPASIVARSEARDVLKDSFRSGFAGAAALAIKVLFGKKGKIRSGFTEKGLAVTARGRRQALWAYQRALNRFLEECEKLGHEERAEGGTSLKIKPVLYGSLVSGEFRSGLYPAGLTYREALSISFGKYFQAPFSPDYPSDMDVYLDFGTYFEAALFDTIYRQLERLSEFDTIHRRLERLSEKIFEEERVLIHLNLRPEKGPLLDAEQFRGEGLIQRYRNTRSEMRESEKQSPVAEFTKGALAHQSLSSGGQEASWEDEAVQARFTKSSPEIRRLVVEGRFEEAEKLIEAVFRNPAEKKGEVSTRTDGQVLAALLKTPEALRLTALLVGGIASRMRDGTQAADLTSRHEMKKPENPHPVNGMLEGAELSVSDKAGRRIVYIKYNLWPAGMYLGFKSSFMGIQDMDTHPSFREKGIMKLVYAYLAGLHSTEHVFMGTSLLNDGALFLRKLFLSGFLTSVYTPFEAPGGKIDLVQARALLENPLQSSKLDPSVRSEMRQNPPILRPGLRMGLLAGMICLGFAVARAVAAEMMPFGYPVDDKGAVVGILLTNLTYEVSMNPQTRVANWAAEELLREQVDGTLPNAGRKNNFRADPRLAKPRAERSDYKKSGYDQGHLVPAADRNWSKEVLSETFFLSNMAPQYPPFNRVEWVKLENWVRQLALQCGKLYVVTGPLYLDKDGKKTGAYRTIGASKVAVPTHFFKVIVIPPVHGDPEGKWESVSFILENTQAKQQPGMLGVPGRIVSIDELEALTGLDLFPKMEPKAQEVFERAKHSGQGLPVLNEGKLAPGKTSFFDSAPDAPETREFLAAELGAMEFLRAIPEEPYLLASTQVHPGGAPTGSSWVQGRSEAREGGDLLRPAASEVDQAVSKLMKAAAIARAKDRKDFENPFLLPESMVLGLVASMRGQRPFHEAERRLLEAAKGFLDNSTPFVPRSDEEWEAFLGQAEAFQCFREAEESARSEARVQSIKENESDVPILSLDPTRTFPEEWKFGAAERGRVRMADNGFFLRGALKNILSESFFKKPVRILVMGSGSKAEDEMKSLFEQFPDLERLCFVDLEMSNLRWLQRRVRDLPPGQRSKIGLYHSDFSEMSELIREEFDMVRASRVFDHTLWSRAEREAFFSGVGKGPLLEEQDRILGSWYAQAFELLRKGGVLITLFTHDGYRGQEVFVQGEKGQPLGSSLVKVWSRDRAAFRDPSRSEVRDGKKGQAEKTKREDDERVIPSSLSNVARFHKLGDLAEEGELSSEDMYWAARLAKGRAYSKEEVELNYGDVLAKLRELLGDLRGKSLVEIGCGDGMLLRYLAEEYGMDVRGIEKSKVALEAARNENGLAGKVWRNDEYAHIPDGFADVVLSVRVLEPLILSEFQAQLILSSTNRMLKLRGLQIHLTSDAPRKEALSKAGYRDVHQASLSSFGHCNHCVWAYKPRSGGQRSEARGDLGDSVEDLGFRKLSAIPSALNPNERSEMRAGDPNAKTVRLDEILKAEALQDIGPMEEPLVLQEIGGREAQEDHALVIRVDVKGVRHGKGQLLAVMDGHGGDEAAAWIQQEIRRSFETLLSKSDNHVERLFRRLFRKGENNIEAAFRALHKKLDEGTARMNAGSTLCLIYIPDDEKAVHAMTVGDSTAVLRHDSQDLPAIHEHNVQDLQAREEHAKKVSSAWSYQFFLRNGMWGLVFFEPAEGGGKPQPYEHQVMRSYGDIAYRERKLSLSEPWIKRIPLPDRGLVSALVATDGIHLSPEGSKKERDLALREAMQNRATLKRAVTRVAAREGADNVTAVYYRWQPGVPPIRSEAREASKASQGSPRPPAMKRPSLRIYRSPKAEAPVAGVSVALGGKKYSLQDIRKILFDPEGSRELGFFLLARLPSDIREALIREISWFSQEKAQELWEYLEAPTSDYPTRLIFRYLKSRDFQAKVEGSFYVGIGKSFEASPVKCVITPLPGDRLKLESEVDGSAEVYDDLRVGDVYLFGRERLKTGKPENEKTEEEKDQEAGNEAVEQERLRAAFQVLYEDDPESVPKEAQIFRLDNSYVSRGVHFSFRVYREDGALWLKIIDHDSSAGTNIFAEIYPDSVRHFADYSAALEENRKEIERLLSAETFSEAFSVVPAAGEDPDLLYKRALDHVAGVFEETEEFQELDAQRKTLIATYMFLNVVGFSDERRDYAADLFDRFYLHPNQGVWEVALDIALENLDKYRRSIGHIMELLGTQKIKLLTVRKQELLCRTLAGIAGPDPALVVGYPKGDPRNTMRITAQITAQIPSMTGKIAPLSENKKNGPNRSEARRGLAPFSPPQSDGRMRPSAQQEKVPDPFRSEARVNVGAADFSPVVPLGSSLVLQFNVMPCTIILLYDRVKRAFQGYHATELTPETVRLAAQGFRESGFDLKDAKYLIVGDSPMTQSNFSPFARPGYDYQDYLRGYRAKRAQAMHSFYQETAADPASVVDRLTPVPDSGNIAYVEHEIEMDGKTGLTLIRRKETSNKVPEWPPEKVTHQEAEEIFEVDLSNLRQPDAVSLGGVEDPSHPIPSTWTESSEDAAGGKVAARRNSDIATRSEAREELGTAARKNLEDAGRVAAAIRKPGTQTVPLSDVVKAAEGVLGYKLTRDRLRDISWDMFRTVGIGKAHEFDPAARARRLEKVFESVRQDPSIKKGVFTQDELVAKLTAVLGQLGEDAETIKPDSLENWLVHHSKDEPVFPIVATMMAWLVENRKEEPSVIDRIRTYLTGLETAALLALGERAARQGIGISQTFWAHYKKRHPAFSFWGMVTEILKARDVEELPFELRPKSVLPEKPESQELPAFQEQESRGGEIASKKQTEAKKVRHLREAEKKVSVAGETSSQAVLAPAMAGNSPSDKRKKTSAKPLKDGKAPVKVAPERDRIQRVPGKENDLKEATRLPKAVHDRPALKKDRVTVKVGERKTVKKNDEATARRSIKLKGAGARRKLLDEESERIGEDPKGSSAFRRLLREGFADIDDEPIFGGSLSHQDVRELLGDMGAGAGEDFFRSEMREINTGDRAQRTAGRKAGDLKKQIMGKKNVFAAPSKYKVVFFDIGNVLLRGDRARTARSLAQYCGRSEREISAAFESTTSSDKRLYEKGMLSGEEFFRRIKEKLGLSADYGTFVQAYTDKFEVIEENAEVLRQLKAAGYKIGVISEIGRISKDYVRSKYPAIFGMVDWFIASCDARMMKDDPKIFDKALKIAGYPAGEAVFIDDLEKNISVAAGRGITGVQFVRGQTDLFTSLKNIMEPQNRHLQQKPKDGSVLARGVAEEPGSARSEARAETSRQTVRNAIEDLKGKFAIVTDMADVAAFTDKQLEEFEVMAHLASNVRFVFCGKDNLILRSAQNDEARKRIDQLQSELGADRIVITASGIEGLAMNKGEKLIHISKGTRDSHLGTRKIYKFRYVGEETGLVPMALLYADQHEKPSPKGTMDLSMVGAALRAALQEFRNSVVFARAA
jgi:endonuclease G